MPLKTVRISKPRTPRMKNSLQNIVKDRDKEKSKLNRIQVNCFGPFTKKKLWMEVKKLDNCYNNRVEILPQLSNVNIIKKC